MASHESEAPLASESTIVTRILRWLGPWAVYALISVIPLAFIIGLYGVVPLGDPSSKRIREQAVLLFLLTPALFTALAYAYSSIFFAGIDAYRPFRASLVVNGLVWAAELAILAPIVHYVGAFNLFGAVAYFICLICVSLGIVIAHAVSRLIGAVDQQKTVVKGALGPARDVSAPSFFMQYRKYMWVELMLVLETCLMVGYIFAFRYGPDWLQSVLPAILRVSVFIWRTALLPLTDFLNLEISMLVTLFWTSNLMDFFLLIAYPVVKRPSAFAAIWATYFIANSFNLFFFLDFWFKIRLWIKSTLKGVFTCKPIEVPPPDESSGNPDERGHSNHRLGYLRRQTRAFIYRMASQLVAAAFYLAVSPVIRFALNKKYFLLGHLSAENYEHSMIFVASNFAFQGCTLIAGIFIIRYKAPTAFAEVVDEFRRNFEKLRYVGAVAAITASNAIISIAIILQHMKIWYAWNNNPLDTSDEN